jgi:hypothetical protein
MILWPAQSSPHCLLRHIRLQPERGPPHACVHNSPRARPHPSARPAYAPEIPAHANRPRNSPGSAIFINSADGPLVRRDHGRVPLATSGPHPPPLPKGAIRTRQVYWRSAPALSRPRNSRWGGPSSGAVPGLLAQAFPLHNPNSVDGVKLPIQHGTSSVFATGLVPGSPGSHPALGSPPTYTRLIACQECRDVT